MPEVEDKMMDDTQPDSAAGEGHAIVYHAIGRVENDFDEPAAPPEIRAVESRIVIDPSLAQGLKGLE
jgi:tRNA (Thr-GGU) A37 N-methylase